MKVTEGVGFTDPKFKRNQSEARRVELPLGYYHFARPDLNNTPEGEARFFLDTVGELKEGEIIALDYEVENRVQPHVDWCKKWLDYVLQKTGVKPLIYMSESVVPAFDWASVVNGGYGLWIAKYLYNPNPDYTGFNIGKWPFAAMYQWTSGQKVPGIPVEKTDGDVFYGDVTTFKKYGYVKPTPIPTPTPAPVNFEALYLEKVTELARAYRSLAAEKTNSSLLQTKISNAKNALA